MNSEEPQMDLVGGGGAEPTLASKDAAAIDALITAGFDASKVPASAERKRISKLTSLLGLLRSGPGPDPALADLTFARVLKAGARAHIDEPTLSADDQEALESLIMSGFDASRVPGALRQRAAHQQALLSSLAASTTTASPDLLDRTLARVQDHVERNENVYNLNAVRAGRSGRGGGLRLRDLLSVAAVILIGSAVLLPVMTSMREQTRRALCKTNLGSTALAMSTYAGANRDSLPVANAGFPGATWWDVGKEPRQSNSANLFTLTRAGYVPLSTLACPGNPAAPTANVAPGAQDWRRLEEVSYSYQIMFGQQRPVWNRGSSAVILADRSPVVLRAIRGEAVDPSCNAPNHACDGQHMLLNDGSVAWAGTPYLANGDNIWLPRSIENRIRQLTGQKPRPSLRGNETPEDADDTFLGP